MEGTWGIAAVWLGLALIVSLISIRFKMSVAELPEVVAVVDEVDEVRQSTEAYFRQIGEAAVEYARSRGVARDDREVSGRFACTNPWN